MIEFLRSLGIKLNGAFNTQNAYVIDLADADEFGKIYSILDKKEDEGIIENDSTESLITIFNASIIYNSDEYQIVLTADYDNDIYKLICSKIF